VDATIGQSHPEIDVSVTADADFGHRRSKKRATVPASLQRMAFAGVRATPYLSRPVVDWFTTGSQVTKIFPKHVVSFPNFETAPNELEFVSGHQLDQESAAQIPASMMGRLLDDGDLRKLQGMLVKKKPPAPSVRRRTTAKRRVGK
jgi:hypothetical protein